MMILSSASIPFANAPRLFKRAHGHTTGIIGEVRAVNALPDCVGRASMLGRANRTARRPSLVAAFHAHPCHPSYELRHPEEVQKQHIGFESDQLPVPSC